MQASGSQFHLYGFASANAILSLQLLDELVQSPTQDMSQLPEVRPKMSEDISQIPSERSRVLETQPDTLQQDLQNQELTEERCATAPNFSEIHQHTQVEPEASSENQNTKAEYQQTPTIKDCDESIKNERKLSKKTTILTMQEIKEQEKLDTQEANLDSQEQPYDLSFLKQELADIKIDARAIIEEILDQVEKNLTKSDNTHEEEEISLVSQSVSLSGLKNKQMKIYNKTIDLSISKQKDCSVESGRKTSFNKKTQNFNVISAKKNPSFSRKDFSLRSSEKNSGMKKSSSGFFMCTEVPYESLPTEINFSLGDEETIKSGRTIKTPRNGSSKVKGLTLMSNSSKKNNNLLTQNQQRSNVIRKVETNPKKGHGKGTCIKLMNLKGKNLINGNNKKTTVHKTIDLNKNVASEPAESARKIKKININASNTTCNPANYFSGRRISANSSSLTHRFL